MVDLRAGAIHDVALNNISNLFGVTIFELPDTKNPTAIKAHINYENGVLRLTADESIDSNASYAFFNRTKFFVRDVTGSDGFDLSGTIIVGNQRPEIYFLTELQRVEGIKISGLLGRFWRCYFGRNSRRHSTTLVATPRLESLNITLSESADRKAPEILTTYIDFNNGTMIFTASETLRVAAAYNAFSFNTSNIVFKNVTNGDEVLKLDPSTKVTYAEADTITIELEESDRASLIPFSSGPGGVYSPDIYGEYATFGGDGGPLLVQFKSGSFYDMAINPNVLSNELLVDSIPDVTRPQILKAEINKWSWPRKNILH